MATTPIATEATVQQVRSGHDKQPVGRIEIAKLASLDRLGVGSKTGVVARMIGGKPIGVRHSQSIRPGSICHGPIVPPKSQPARKKPDGDPLSQVTI